MQSLTEKAKASKAFVIYILGFLFVLHVTLPVYINSTFLSHFTGEQNIGLVYSIGSLLTILFFSLVPGIMERIGNYRTILWLLIIEVVSLVGLAYGDTFGTPADIIWLVVPAFIVSFVAIAVINFNIDVFLENFIDREHVGRVRGVYLTILNIAWLAGQFILARVAEIQFDFWKVYLASAFLLIPVIFIIRAHLRDFVDPLYTKTPLWRTIKEVWADKNILGIFMCSFLMQFFFAWMVIYSPIYLHDHIGFSISSMSDIFTIMLLPFVLIELPLGRLADSTFGEKEIMSIGFIVAAIATGVMALIVAPTFAIWAVVLFFTRVGASMVEIMSETYFFKKVTTVNVNTVSLFRTMRPFAYLVSPLIATILLTFLHMPIKYLFVVLALLMFYGLRFSLALEDTL